MKEKKASLHFTVFTLITQCLEAVPMTCSSKGASGAVHDDSDAHGDCHMHNTSTGEHVGVVNQI